VLKDSEIINLYLARSENAINETARQYGAYCHAIAMNILHNREDADECLNDAYLNLWNSIPPEIPREFSTYIGRITRNLSIKRYRARKALKRGGNDTTLLLSELESCIPSDSDVQNEVEMSELARKIDSFLASINQEDKFYFTLRYWYAESISEIAKQFGAGESKVKVSLHRTRKKLKAYLEKEGFVI
jgi:RNA polymerase sigma-70 factor (ECF subfamily)